MPLKKIEILGYDVLDESAAKVAADVCEGFGRQTPRSFVFLNPHSIVLAGKDPSLKAAIMKSSDIFCDGIGLSMASVLLKHQRVHRVYGYEFFMAMSAEMVRKQNCTVFFLGGTDESLPELCSRYAADFPGVRIESWSPPFKSHFSDADIADMGRRVAATGADVLWVGLGSPKQEKMLHALIEHSGAHCAAAIGAVFDFYTDRVPHAPAWVRRIGLQWAHRLVLEPRRLWKRTLISTPLFLSQVAKALVVPPRRN